MIYAILQPKTLSRKAQLQLLQEAIKYLCRGLQNLINAMRKCRVQTAARKRSVA